MRFAVSQPVPTLRNNWENVVGSRGRTSRALDAGAFTSVRLDLDNRLEWRKILINNDLDDTTTRLSLSLSLFLSCVGVRKGDRINLLADAIICYPMPQLQSVRSRRAVAAPRHFVFSWLQRWFKSANYLVER